MPCSPGVACTHVLQARAESYLFCRTRVAQHGALTRLGMTDVRVMMNEVRVGVGDGPPEL